MAIQVMKEVGIDISGQYSKGVEAIPLNQIQRIVTLWRGSGQLPRAIRKSGTHPMVTF